MKCCALEGTHAGVASMSCKIPKERRARAVRVVTSPGCFLHMMIKQRCHGAMREAEKKCTSTKMRKMHATKEAQKKANAAGSTQRHPHNIGVKCKRVRKGREERVVHRSFRSGSSWKGSSRYKSRQAGRKVVENIYLSWPPH